MGIWSQIFEDNQIQRSVPGSGGGPYDGPDEQHLVDCPIVSRRQISMGSRVRKAEAHNEGPADGRGECLCYMLGW